MNSLPVVRGKSSQSQAAGRTEPMAEVHGRCVVRILIEEQQEMAGFFVVKPESAGVMSGRKAISFP